MFFLIDGGNGKVSAGGGIYLFLGLPSTSSPPNEIWAILFSLLVRLSGSHLYLVFNNLIEVAVNLNIIENKNKIILFYFVGIDCVYYLLDQFYLILCNLNIK